MGHHGNGIFHLLLPKQTTSFQDEFSRKQITELPESWSTSKGLYIEGIIRFWCFDQGNLWTCLLDHELLYLPWRDKSSITELTPALSNIIDGLREGMHNLNALGKLAAASGQRNSNETEGGQPRGKLQTIKWEHLLCSILREGTTAKERDSGSNLVTLLFKSCSKVFSNKAY